MPAVPEPLDRLPRVWRRRHALRERRGWGELQLRRLWTVRRPAQPVRRSPGRRRWSPDAAHGRGGSLRSPRSGALRHRRPRTTPRVVDDGPLGYWRLGEASGAVVDAIGSNDGAVSGTVTRDVAGALASGDDGAILFNGSSGVVRMGDVFDITAGSYELWIKRSNTNAALQYIMDKGPGQPNIALLSDHSIYVGEENVWWLSSTVPINDTNWHHIAFTHPGGAASGLAKLYIDGVDRTLTLGGANLVANSSNLSVGAGYGDFLHFAGTIDEVALYGRAADPGGGRRPLPGRPERHGPQPAEDARRRDPPRGPCDRRRRGRKPECELDRSERPADRRPWAPQPLPDHHSPGNERSVGGRRRLDGMGGDQPHFGRGVMRSSRTSAGRATRALDASRATTAQTSRCARACTRRAQVP